MSNWTPQSVLEEEDLATLLRASEAPNDNDALQAFVDRFGSPMRYWLRETLRDAPSEDISDAYQELLQKFVFGNALIGYKQGRGSPRAYLSGVARNFAIDIHRRDARHAAETSYDDSFAEDAARLADNAPPKSEDELIQAIVEHLRKLDVDRVRLAIYKAILEEHDPAEIARRTGKSIPTVYRYRADLLAIVREVLGVSPAKKVSSP